MAYNLSEQLARYASDLPHFPDGRIDYTTSESAPVVNCFIRVGDEILLMKRSNAVGHYQRKWFTVAGYIDEDVSPREKMLKELHEEVGIEEHQIADLSVAEPFEYYDAAIPKKWIIYSGMATLKEKPQLRLDHEHTEARWIRPQDIKEYDTLHNLQESLLRATGA